MRKIPLSFGLLYYLEELDASEAALSADPDAKELAAPFHDSIKEWDDIFKQQRQARRDVIRADAVVAVKNARLDMTTTRFAKMVAAVASDLLNKFFKIAPGRFVRRGLRKQCEDTEHVLVKELDKLDKKHPLQPFRAELETGAKEALASLNTRSKVKGARQTVANEIDEYKEGVNALRTTTYAELLKIATEKGYPKAWVESFFRAETTAAEEQTEESEPATPDTTAKTSES